MKQKTTNIKNLKRAGTILAIAGGLAIGTATFIHTTNDNNDTDPTEKKEYVNHSETAADELSTADKKHFEELERMANEMTTEQKLLFIQNAQKSLDIVQQKLDSDKTNPDDRIHAMQSKRIITQDLEIMQKKLGNER